MLEYYQGIIAAVTMLGGMCAFITALFYFLEKRLESKMDSVVSDVHNIALELKQERIDKMRLYEFILNRYADKKV